MTPSIVTFLWRPKPSYRSQFAPLHVNLLYKLVRKHYAKLERFICVTDYTEGFHPNIELFPLWNDYANIPNPSWPEGPSCYRRLATFAPEFEKVAGKRFAVMDLDVVPVANLSPLLDRPEDFLIWRTGHQHTPLCASFFLMTAGSKEYVWRYFKHFPPEESIAMAKRAGYRGSDQAWITYCLGEACPGWTERDGVYGYSRLAPKPPRRRVHVPRNIIRRGGYGSPGVAPLPAGARLVIFTGKPDPWDPEAQVMSPWIRDQYQSLPAS